MEASLLLLNADAVGSETLKNLVLPGIGSFTIADEKVVTESDLGCNFFVTKEDIGKSRADAVRNWLVEMNEDVKGGDSILESPSSLIETNPSVISKFSFVIAANLPQSTLVPLSKLCWEQNIPLLIVRAYGFIGYTRLQLKSHDILEGKPDPNNGIIHDIRISNSFKELEDFAESITIGDLDIFEHKHVPFIVILIQVLNQFKAKNNRAPTSKDRAELNALITDMAMDLNDEQNFQEAITNIAKLWYVLLLN